MDILSLMEGHQNSGYLSLLTYEHTVQENYRVQLVYE
jgi:hypothetical protein